MIKNAAMILYCSAVFLNNTKTPNFTFLGVKLGVYFAIC